MKTLIALSVCVLLLSCSSTKETVTTHQEVTKTQVESPPLRIDSVAGVKDNTYQPSEKVEPPQREPERLLPEDPPQPQETPIKKYEQKKFKVTWKNDLFTLTADAYAEGVEINKLWLKNVVPKFKFVTESKSKTVTDSKKETVKKSFTDSFKDFWNTLLPLWKITFLVLALAFLALSVKGMLSFWKK